MIGKLGGDEGATRGPAPGDGADVHSEGGAPDIEGTPPQELPHLRGHGRLASGEVGNIHGGPRTWLAALAATLAVIGAILLVAAAVLQTR